MKRWLCIVIVAAAASPALAQAPGAEPVMIRPAPAQFANPTSTVPYASYELHHGFTIEGSSGVGMALLTGSTGAGTHVSDVSLAGLGVGLGAWLTPRFALTARVAGVGVSADALAKLDGTGVELVVGPSLQYWLTPRFWVSGGLGYAAFAVVGAKETTPGPPTLTGFGADLRAGYTLLPAFWESHHMVYVSVEVTPARVSNGTASGTVTGVGFLVGYHYL
jgi:hypothetical protein